MYKCPKCGKTFKGPGRHTLQCGNQKTVVCRCSICSRTADVLVPFSLPAHKAPIPDGWHSQTVCGECAVQHNIC